MRENRSLHPQSELQDKTRFRVPQRNGPVRTRLGRSMTAPLPEPVLPAHRTVSPRRVEPRSPVLRIGRFSRWWSAQVDLHGTWETPALVAAEPNVRQVGSCGALRRRGTCCERRSPNAAREHRTP